MQNRQPQRRLRRYAQQSATKLVLTAIFATTTALPSHAATIVWIGGDGIWDSSILKWSPFDEPDPDDDVVIGNNDTVTMGMDNSIHSLAIIAGAALRTDQYALQVADSISLGGTLQVASNSLTGPLPPVSLTAGGVDVVFGGQFRMANTVQIVDPSGVGDFNIHGGGTLYGNGNLHFADIFTGTQTLLTNNGEISVGNVTNSLFPLPGPPPARTLHISASDTGALFDLDGNGNGVVNVHRNGTLDIDGTVTDFTGEINLFHNSTLDISNGWLLGQSAQSGATLTVDNGFVSGGITRPGHPCRRRLHSRRASRDGQSEYVD